MPSFQSDTVHGLSADVYFNSVPLRVFGDITFAVSQEVLALTANDEGNVNPVDVLRRGDVTTVTIPVSNTTGLAVISGVLLPFASTVSGVSGMEVMLPKAQPGDSFLSKAQELRLVLRDGSATIICGAAVVTELAELTLAEESQQAWAATFTCYRTTVSGVETPWRIISGSVITGPA
jgi:hypothetical protein